MTNLPKKSDCLAESEDPCMVAAGQMKNLCGNLGPRWAGALVWAALRSLGPYEYDLVAAAILSEPRAGPPLPPFDGLMAEAEFWADAVTPREREAYAVACCQRMAPHRLAALLHKMGKTP